MNRINRNKVASSLLSKHAPAPTARKAKYRVLLIDDHPILRKGLAELINDETGIATDTVELDKSFTDDLDIDSISMMTIVVNAEEKFDVKIPDEEVKNLKTVGDAVTFITAAQG